MIPHLGAIRLALFGLIGIAIVGCNATAGVGRDIEATGGFIEDSAEDAKN
jgi:predicted small secreted protein